MMVVTLLILALAGYAVAAHSRPHTAATLAHAQAFIAGQRQQNLEQCLADAKSGLAGPDGEPAPTEADCQQLAEQFQPSVEQFQGYPPPTSRAPSGTSSPVTCWRGWPPGRQRQDHSQIWVLPP